MVLTMENLSVFHDWIEALLDSTQSMLRNHLSGAQTGYPTSRLWIQGGTYFILFYQYSLVDLKGCFVNLTAAQTSDSQIHLWKFLLFTSVLSRVL